MPKSDAPKPSQRIEYFVFTELTGKLANIIFLIRIKSGSIMNNKLLLAIGLMLLISVIVLASNLISAPSTPSLATDQQQPLDELSIEEGFIEAEQLINSRAPIKIDDQTRLNKAVAGPGDLMTYFYSLTNVIVGDVNPASLLDDIKPKLLASLCSNADMQPVLQAGAKLVYVYSDKNNQDVGRIEVVAADC